MTRAQLLELSAGVILLGGAVGAAAYWGRARPAGRAGAFPVSRPAEPIAAPDLELPDLSGPAGAAPRPSGPRGAAELLGDLVRAVPRGDARARDARAGARPARASPSWA